MGSFHGGDSTESRHDVFIYVVDTVGRVDSGRARAKVFRFGLLEGARSVGHEGRQWMERIQKKNRKEGKKTRKQNFSNELNIAPSRPLKLVPTLLDQKRYERRPSMKD